MYFKMGFRLVEITNSHSKIMIFPRNDFYNLYMFSCFNDTAKSNML